MISSQYEQAILPSMKNEAEGTCEPRIALSQMPQLSCENTQHVRGLTPNSLFDSKSPENATFGKSVRYDRQPFQHQQHQLRHAASVQVDGCATTKAAAASQGKPAALQLQRCHSESQMLSNFAVPKKTVKNSEAAQAILNKQVENASQGTLTEEEECSMSEPSQSRAMSKSERGANSQTGGASGSQAQSKRKKNPKYCIQWSTAEDEKLLGFVEKFGQNSWNRISKLLPGKSEIKCHTRWLELNNCSHFAKGTWTKEEDEILTRIVVQQGAKNWTHVAKSLPGRIGKQCRERWHNHLDPNITKRKWTIDEDLLIVKLHLVHGNRWCDIAKQVNGRTDNAIKNRFNSNLSKRLKEPQFARLLSQDGPEKTTKSENYALKEETVALEAASEPREAPKPVNFLHINDCSSSGSSSRIKVHGSILKASVQLGKPGVIGQKLSSLISVSFKRRREAKLALKRGFSDFNQGARKFSSGSSDDYIMDGTFGTRQSVRDYQIGSLVRGFQQLRPMPQRSLMSQASSISSDSQRRFTPKILIQKQSPGFVAPAEQTVSNVWKQTIVSMDRSQTAATLNNLTTTPSVTMTPDSVRITASPPFPCKRQKTSEAGDYITRVLPANEQSVSSDAKAILKRSQKHQQEQSDDDACFSRLNMILGSDSELVIQLSQVLAFSVKSKRLAYSVPLFSGLIGSTPASAVSQSN